MLILATRCFRVATTLGNIPGDVGFLAQIVVVGSHLAVHADDPHGGDSSIDDGTDDRVPDVEEEHADLDQQNKHRQDRDRNIKVRQAADGLASRP